MNSKILSVTIFTVLILSLFTVEAAETHKSIPKLFQGKWSSSLENCVIDDEADLEIFKNHIAFPESDGTAISIVTKQNNELALIVELSGEGEE